ncbi:MAG: response regulator [candidate division KSB1 bacterium]|nr:response regulator [candidate division KSB1 bacterium]MDZ7318313.1 response regulator [candidate division KSB1 bacterium]MDZ7340730.1 response regulator [candidate division KSB1 bacterium]
MADGSISQKKIFVIDDDPVMRLSCSKILEKEGYSVETYEDGAQGLEHINGVRPDLLVVDLKMPKIGGIEVIRRVHEIDVDICIVVITGYATIGTAVEAMKAGAYDFLPKPFTPDELRLIVKRGLERSDLARQSQRLRQEKEALQRSFITFVSHQLQSPLVAVQQYFDVLRHLEDSPDKPKLQQEWIERSAARIQELLDMIRDWLTIAKIESGQFAECLTQVDIAPIIHNLVQAYAETAAVRKIALTTQIPPNLSLVSGHESCLQMLFSNLIVNAIKYNKDHGRVDITAADAGDFVLVNVSDSGIGIPEDKLDMIFEEFYRIKSEATKNIPGTGLGLPICKKIIDELGGKITVASKINEGSTFSVYLPKFKD